MALSELVPTRVSGKRAGKASPSSSGRRASGKVVSTIEVYPKPILDHQSSSATDVTWTMFLSDERIGDSAWSLSIWISDTSMKLECMKTDERTGSVFRVSNVFNRHELVLIGFNPRYSLDLIAKMIESSLQNGAEHSGPLAPHSSYYHRTCIVSILDRNGLEIENSEVTPPPPPPPILSSTRMIPKDDDISDHSYRTYHTVILTLTELDIEQFDYRFIFRKNELLLLSDELQLCKQRIIRLESKLETSLLKIEELQNNNELLRIEHETREKKIRRDKDAQISQLQNELQRLKKQLRDTEHRKNAEIERLTLDLGEMVEALEHATLDLAGHSGDIDITTATIDGSSGGAGRGPSSSLSTAMMMAEMDDDDPLMKARTQKKEFVFDDEKDRFDREIYEIKEDGRLLTLSGAWDWHCTYLRCNSSMSSISDVSSMMDSMKKSSTVSSMIREWVDLQIKVSKYNDLMFGITESSEIRTQGFFGDPLKGIGYYALYGSLYCPNGKCLTPFADPCKSGDTVRICVDIDCNSNRAELSFGKVMMMDDSSNSGSGAMIPLGSPIDLDGLLDWTNGLKFVIVSCNTGDQLRIL